MYLFSFATVSLGTYAGYWLWQNYGGILLTVYYHRKYTTETEYLDLYDCLDDEEYFNLMKNDKHTAQEYSEFILRHQEARQYAFGYFSDFISDHKATLKKVLVKLLLISLLFNILLPLFLSTVLIVFIGQILYAKIIKHDNANIFIYILFSRLLDRYNSSENLIYYAIPDSIETTPEQKKNKLFKEILKIEEKFWRPPNGGTSHIKKYFAANGLFIMPTPDGTWRYLSKQEYIYSQPDNGAQDVYHKIKDIKFNKVSKDIVVISYWLTAIYEQGQDYRVLICSTYKKNKQGVWQQLVHQQEYAKY